MHHYPMCIMLVTMYAHTYMSYMEVFTCVTTDVNHHCIIQSLLQIVDKLPTIGTQLKIIASVKATTQGGDGQFYAHIRTYTSSQMLILG